MEAIEIIKQVHEEAQKGVLVMWTVYDHPTDHPGGFIARRHDVGKGGKPIVTDHVITGGLENIRTLFKQAGLTVIPRHQQDDPVIVECWL